MRKRKNYFALTVYSLVAAALAGGSSGCDPVRDVSTDGDRTATRQASAAASREQEIVQTETSIQMIARTEASGVEFSYQNGETSNLYTILETLGGGVGVLDFDADGNADLFFPGGGEVTETEEIRGRQSVLYRNETNWKFGDVTVLASLNQADTYTHGVAVCDYDDDGFSDILITGYGQLQFYRNQGDGTFRDVASISGISSAQWSTSAAFADVSGDRHPDLYICNYVNWSFDNNPICRSSNGQNRDPCSPRRFDPLPDSLFVSAGDGTFVECAVGMGLSQEGKGLGVVIADLDLDDDLDVYVTNDTVPNFLYRNDAGHLTEQGLTSGSALNAMGTPDGSMGVSLGDFNADGLPDLWVANFEQENFALYRNEGRLQFQPVSLSMGIARIGSQYVGWGTAFTDFDLDGDEDLVVANGHVNRHPARNNVRQLPLMLENDQGTRFNNVSEAVGSYFSTPHRGRGLAAVDIDNDGDTDLVVTHLNEPVELLENESKREGNWLQVRLVGTSVGRIPVGAQVAIRLSDSREWTRQLYMGGSYLSSSDDTLSFSAGSDQYVDLHIHWPDGNDQTLSKVAVNQRITVIQQ
ncbi:MAG: CRTAC1 family protein [Rhodopirellula sp.]|nr:CRTAC1 family protein [Rhodopirellula sp.]